MNAFQGNFNSTFMNKVVLKQPWPLVIHCLWLIMSYSEMATEGLNSCDRLADR